MKNYATIFPALGHMRNDPDKAVKDAIQGVLNPKYYYGLDDKKLQKLVDGEQ